MTRVALMILAAVIFDPLTVVAEPQTLLHEQTFLHETVSVDGVSATVGVGHGADFPHSGNFVGVLFRVPKGSAVSVDCISVNKDFRYVLRNGTGQVVPINLRALASLNIPPGNLMPMPEQPCTVEKVGGKSIRWLPLAPLYPNLQPGTYTLQITFAPRGLSKEVSLPTVTITVDKDHPL